MRVRRVSELSSRPLASLTCRQATPMPTAPMSSRWLARNCSSLVTQPPCKVTAGHTHLDPEAGRWGGKGRPGAASNWLREGLAQPSNAHRLLGDPG